MTRRPPKKRPVIIEITENLIRLKVGRGNRPAFTPEQIAVMEKFSGVYDGMIYQRMADRDWLEIMR